MSRSRWSRIGNPISSRCEALLGSLLAGISLTGLWASWVWSVARGTRSGPPQLSGVVPVVGGGGSGRWDRRGWGCTVLWDESLPVRLRQARRSVSLPGRDSLTGTG